VTAGGGGISPFLDGLGVLALPWGKEILKGIGAGASPPCE